MLAIRNFIDGQFHDAVSGDRFDKINPATAAVSASVPDSDARDVERAVEAARRAFPAWSRLSVAERSRLLFAVAQRIDDRLDELALAETTDTGKPLRNARVIDIPRAASNFRFFASIIVNFHSEAYRTDQLALNYTLRQPRGVAGIISPWNLPLYLFTWKVAPALATGNTVVSKPSELTPTTAFLLGQIAQEVGLPPGVLNIVHGLGAKVGAAIVVHPRVPAVSFTGGTVTGAEIARAAAPMFKRVALEMGGKNPNIVFADADLDEVVTTSLRSSFENQGEICLCGSRLFVEESLYPTFVERFVAATKQLKVGDPLEPDTQQGALISKRHFDKVAGYIHLARQEGGTILCGGAPPANLPPRCKDGYFLQPTVVTDLDVNCRVNQEEIFGPVVTITPFKSEQEVVAFANSTPHGLSASLWTQNLARAHRVAEQLECGTVWINCWLLRDLRVPFGGVKTSGVGREGGEEALRFFTEAKTVCVRYPTEAPAMIQIVDGLYLGNRESARDLRRLEEAGVTHIVNCTDELPNYHEGRFVYLAMKLLDPDPGFHKHITKVCAFIDDARTRGKVLVHCFASISRSPAVVLSYLCHLGDPLDQAAARLARIVWTSPDRIFLAQLAAHHGLSCTDEELRLLEYTLQGRAADA